MKNTVFLLPFSSNQGSARAHTLYKRGAGIMMLSNRAVDGPRKNNPGLTNNWIHSYDIFHEL